MFTLKAEIGPMTNAKRYGTGVIALQTNTFWYWFVLEDYVIGKPADGWTWTKAAAKKKIDNFEKCGMF